MESLALYALVEFETASLPDTAFIVTHGSASWNYMTQTVGVALSSHWLCNEHHLRPSTRIHKCPPMRHLGTSDGVGMME